MPGFYNEKQAAYFKKQELDKNQKLEKKQKYLEGIRTRAFVRTHTDVGQSKPLYGKPAKVDPNAQHGVPGFKIEPSVKEIFQSWAGDPYVYSGPPVNDKNHKKINKHAVTIRATTAKQQGEFRRTEYGENGIRWTEDELMKRVIFPGYKPKGTEVYGKALDRNHVTADIVTNLYGVTAGKKQIRKNQLETKKFQDQ